MKDEADPRTGDLPAKVQRGELPKPEELLSYLSVEDADVRAGRLFALSEALAGAGHATAAAELARRALSVSRDDARYLEPCVARLAGTGDALGVREALKRAGMRAARENRIVEALELFNRSFYAYATCRREDRYDYDFEMLAAIEAMAPRHPGHGSAAGTGERIRIAVLVFGALHVGSVLVKILATFAAHADRSRFELAFFVPEASRAVSGSDAARAQLGALRDPGWPVEVPRSNDPLEVMLKTAGAIHEWRADLLLTSALCADLRHYFIASTRPAPRLVALVQGPPPQFTVPWADWNIAVSAHPGMDAPGNCSVVPLEVALPERRFVDVDRRERHGLPRGSPLIVSGGRPIKFESRAYWQAVGAILRRHPEVILVCLGLDQLPALAREELASEVAARVRLIPWRDDYLRVLGMADVVLDTYPSGGGVVLLDAMALGIPVVSFANDYVHRFDQTDWGLGNEFVKSCELVTPRGDVARLTEIVVGLLDDPERRVRLGQQCEALVRAERGSPDRMIRRWEEVLWRVARGDASPVDAGPATRGAVQVPSGGPGGNAERAAEAPLGSSLRPRLRRWFGRS